MIIIFTDLDGTLLNQDDYRYDPAIPVVQELQARKFPVIPVTSKTRSEVEILRQEMNLTDPFIVENGSAIFSPVSCFFNPVDSYQQSHYYLKQLGCTYSEARQGLQIISTALGETLQGFGDLTNEEIQRLTGLSNDAVIRAKEREFSEPFMTPSQVSFVQLKQIVQSQNFQVVVGDRFCHLIGLEAGKGKAVQWLRQQYQMTMPDVKLFTVGLGNSPNDLELLENVDFPIIIPGHKGVHPELAGRGWEIAPAPGSQGWAIAVAKLNKQVIM